MRKIPVLLLLALLVVGLTAAPALAQRDPFDPAIDEEGQVTQPEDPDDDGEEDPADDGDEGAGDDAAGPEELADTGADVEPLLVLAYALISFGVGALIVGRLYSRYH